MCISGGIPVNYQQRRPEKTTLYGLVKDNYKTFLLDREEECRTVAPYIRREFEQYLRCGILAYGFGRFYCSTCKKDLLVPFSCKKRGFCSSCCSRRMAEVIPSSDVLALRKNQKNSTSCLSTTDSPMFYFGFEKSPSSTNISSEEIPYFNLGPAALTLRKNLSYGALSTFHHGQPQPQDENRSRSSSLSSTSSSGLEKLQFELEL